MKVKNAVVGTRVQIKKSVTSSYYKAGQTGVIEELDIDNDALVRFDHDNDYWYVLIADLKRIKE